MLFKREMKAFKIFKNLAKKENNDYINSYNYFSSNYVDFFLSYHPNKKKNDNEVHLAIS